MTRHFLYQILLSAAQNNLCNCLFHLNVNFLYVTICSRIIINKIFAGKCSLMEHFISITKWYIYGVSSTCCKSKEKWLETRSEFCWLSFMKSIYNNVATIHIKWCPCFFIYQYLIVISISIFIIQFTIIAITGFFNAEHSAFIFMIILALQINHFFIWFGGSSISMSIFIKQINVTHFK